MVNDAWQIDATLGYNDGARFPRRQTLTLTDDDWRRLRARDRSRRARGCPLTPDWSGALGIEWRSRGQLLNAQPFARLDLAYVGEVVTNLEGFESVVGQAGVSTQDAYETARFPRRTRGRGLERLACSWRTSADERAVTFRSNRWAEPRLSIIRPRTYGLQFRYDF